MCRVGAGRGAVKLTRGRQDGFIYIETVALIGLLEVIYLNRLYRLIIGIVKRDIAVEAIIEVSVFIYHGIVDRSGIDLRQRKIEGELARGGDSAVEVGSILKPAYKLGRA